MPEKQGFVGFNTSDSNLIRIRVYFTQIYSILLKKCLNWFKFWFIFGRINAIYYAEQQFKLELYMNDKRIFVTIISLWLLLTICSCSNLKYHDMESYLKSNTDRPAMICTFSTAAFQTARAEHMRLDCTRIRRSFLL